MATPQSQFRIGDYEFVKLLGRGGMGEVWLASDLRADRLVAVKLIKQSFLDDPASRTRFLNEAKTLGRLEHERIVTLYNVVEDQAHLALVIRFIEGVSLADRIDKEGALPVDFVLSSARDILSALGFAHQHGIIHRDIKPQNVLLDRQNRSFLSDFGIAIADFAERNTSTGFAIGTPHYMSPEQIRTPHLLTGQNGGHRSDIYSYGIVLYEMLTGRVPFCEESGFAVQTAHCSNTPPPLREVNPNVSAAVEHVVLWCLEKDPDDRPQSCAELLEEFTRAASGVEAPRAKSVGYSATVVEKPRVPAAGAAQPPNPAPGSSSASATPPMRRFAWLGAGVLVIAAGISWGIVTSKHTPAEAPKKTEATSTPGTPPNTGTGTGQTGAGQTVTGASNVPQNPLPGSGNGPRPDTGKGGTTIPAVQTVPINGPNPAAERSYSQALDFLNRNAPCDGLNAIESAVQLDPRNTKYQVLKNRLTGACGVVKEAASYIGKAQSEFQQGDNCEAKNDADEAIKRDPRNPTYLALQERYRKACELQ